MSIHRPVGWGCKINRLLFYRGVRTPLNEYPGYDNKQYDGDASVVLELWGMRTTLSLPSFPGPPCPEVVAPERVLSMGQIVVSDI